jgi:hypothetical protein
VHVDVVGACANHQVDEPIEAFLGVLVVDADAALHRDGQMRDLAHRTDARRDQFGLRHQARAEAAVLHPVGRTADIEIDFVVTEVLADARRCAERRGIATAELQRHRVFGRIERQQARAIAAQHRAGGKHLGIDQRPAREQAMEVPAVPVGPLHHRGDTEPAGPTFRYFFRFFSHLNVFRLVDYHRPGFRTCSSQSHIKAEQILWLSIWQ